MYKHARPYPRNQFNIEIGDETFNSLHEGDVREGQVLEILEDGALVAILDLVCFIPRSEINIKYGLLLYNSYKFIVNKKNKSGSNLKVELSMNIKNKKAIQPRKNRILQKKDFSEYKNSKYEYRPFSGLKGIMANS